MIINTNPVAIDIHRRLKINRDNNSKSLEKLSSGMSINRAGDDAAGLAISEKMRGQIRGLNQASRNTQDGISLIQTAEGSLNEIHAILQRMRELVIEGSNDTLTDEDRELIQQEVVHMKHGIDDIAHNTEFNTIKLLNGSLEDINSRSTKPLTLEWDVEIESPKYITSITKTSDGGVIVAGASDDSSHHIENQRSSWMAKINSDGIVEWEKFPPKDGEYNVVYDIKETSNGDFILSTRSSHNYNFPIVYKLDNKGDIKGKSRLTGMFEKFLTNVIETNEGNFVFTGSHFGGRHDISIVVMDNELNVLETKEVKTPNEQDRWDAHDIRQTHDGGYIIAGLLQTDNGQLGMVIKLDENFQIQWSSFVEDENFKSIIEDKDGNFIVLGKKNLYSFDANGNGSNVINSEIKFLSSGYFDKQNYINEIDSGNYLIGAGDKIYKVDNLGNEIWNIKTDESLIKNPYKQVEIIATTQVNDGGFVAVSNSQWIFKYTGEDISESEGLILQIGANEGQDIKLHIGDVSTKALGINKVYINNKEYAQNSIGLIDKAIEKVSAERSKLGAYQNRLEHIIANLDNTSENLQASESRIRDLDMAKEMMEFTKNNILQQSSQAILAQANQMPQLVLQLLDFK